MAGHSKWANIKHKKSAQDKKRSGLFSKLSKDITIAARGGGDPSSNFKLRLAIEKAKKSNMPKDNIERAVKKGTGESGGEMLEEVLYEGYGPKGVAVIVEATTDNKNRTAATVRAAFTKSGGSLGSSNSVMWMFDHRAQFVLDPEVLSGKDFDEFSLEALENNAIDIQQHENEIVIFSEVKDFQMFQEFLDSQGIKTKDSSLAYIPNTVSDIEDEEVLEKIQKFINTLEDDEDVNNVIVNLV